MDDPVAVHPATTHRARGRRVIAAQRARLFAVALALVAATSLSGCVTIVQAPPDPSPKPNVVGTSTDVLTMHKGDCVNDVTIDGEVATLPTVDCSLSHDSEIYDEIVLPDTAYPGAAAVDKKADDACYASFPAFAGISYEDSSLGYSDYVPTKSGWDAGDRVILCTIMAVDEDDNTIQTTGTLKNARL